MLPYERFKNEADFREAFVKPLLNRLGFYGVSEHHGNKELGKDFVFSERHRLGGMRHYAAQVKHERTIDQGNALDGLVTQVRQAFARPFKRADSPQDCHVSAVYIFNSGEIAADAKEQLLNDLGQARYGDNVHFLDGARLDALNKWAVLQSDVNARARLLGLRSALHVIIFDLSEYRIQGKDTLAPIFVHGLEFVPSRAGEFRHGAAPTLVPPLEPLTGHRRTQEDCTDRVGSCECASVTHPGTRTARLTPVQTNSRRGRRYNRKDESACLNWQQEAGVLWRQCPRPTPPLREGSKSNRICWTTEERFQSRAWLWPHLTGDVGKGFVYVLLSLPGDGF